nr:RNA-directed DNA polymerase, eukaryota [Tanacetum cinerariifolium]
MGSYRSKEDDVSKISTLIFFHPFEEVERRAPKNGGNPKHGEYDHVKKDTGVNRNDANVPCKNAGLMDNGKSFAHAVLGNTTSGTADSESIPAIVLDDECLYSKYFSKSLLRRVKEFASLSNLKAALINEEFADLNIRYMGELWVMLEFNNIKSKDLLKESVGAGSWFSVLRQVSNDFTPEGRIVWVEVEGIPLKFWLGNTFKRIASKWGELLDVDDKDEMCFHSKSGDDNDVEEVPKMLFDESSGQKVVQLEDPFGIYPLLNKHNNDQSEDNHSLKYPPGFTPENESKENEPNGDSEQSTKQFSDQLDMMGIINSLKDAHRIQAAEVSQKAKVKWAVWDCGTDKSPGPDGFTFGFYRHFWAMIENDVFEAVKCFFTYDDIPVGCNAVFIALIQKISDANLVKDFRPISLIGSIYKIIAKILANRLVGVLEDIVNEIQSCLRSSRGSILINGSPMEEFQFFKGLKQGDMLSPFLFILVMESLHLSFQRVVDAVSGMRINMSKSRILGVLVGESKIKNAAVKLGCLILKTPFLYLGTKVGGSMSRVLSWKVVVDKKSSFWTRVIKAIHGDDGSVGKNKLASVRSCWMNIVHESKELENLGVNIFDYIQLKVGNGESTLFWEEKWIDGLVLKDLFPHLYTIETNKKATVRVKMMGAGLDYSFCRKARRGAEHF